MKLDHFVDTEVLSDGDMQGQDYGIAADGMGMAIRAFYQYAKPIEALVREVASNSFDSHREAAIIPNMSDDDLRSLGYTGDLDNLRNHFTRWKERDVEIELSRPDVLGDTERKIIFRDYGVGISPLRMKNIMTKFFSSTKRATNEMIGAFGLGSKSPLGYTNAFQMNTWFFGIRYEYLIHSGTTAPRLELIAQEPDTSRVNGTDVIVAIKDEVDYGEFQQAVIEQLRYFDGFTIIGVPKITESTVHQGKYFRFRGDEAVDKMHICLGKVFYPLDATACGINWQQSRCPIALYFDIGELPVVWNRESIEYTVESKRLIKERFDSAVQELQGIWDEQFADIKTAEEFVNAHIQGANKTMRLPNGVQIPEADSLIAMEAVWPDHPNVTKDPLYSWEVSKCIVDGKTSKTSYWSRVANVLTEEDVVFYMTDDNVSKPNINAYLHEGLGHKKIFLVKRSHSFDPDHRDIDKFSGLHWQLGKANWNDEADKVDFVATLLEVEEYIRSQSQGDYDNLDIPDEWAQKLRERAKLRRMSASKIPKDKIKIRANMPLTIRPLQFYESFSYFIKHTTIGELENYKGLILFADQTDHASLIAAAFALQSMGYSFLQKWAFSTKTNRGMERVIICKVSKDAMKTLDEMNNAMHVKAFLSSKNGFWRHWLTAQLLKESWPAGSNVFTGNHYSIPMMDKMSMVVSRLSTYMHRYSEQPYMPSDSRQILSYKNKELFEAEHWDHNILVLFKKLKAYSERWKLLRYINLNQIPTEDLAWVLDQVGHDNPELIYRNMKRKGLLITNNEEE